MDTLRPAARADAWPIRKLIWRVGINPTGLDWRRFMVIVDQHNHLLACAQIKPHRDGSRELASLAVQPDQRGKGLARRLIEYFLVHSTPPLYLTCARHNRPLYEHFDFRVLAPAEMPPELLRLHRLVNSYTRLLHRPDAMLVMAWYGKSPGTDVK